MAVGLTGHSWTLDFTVVEVQQTSPVQDRMHEDVNLVSYVSLEEKHLL